jgi:hypothetical protein
MKKKKLDKCAAGNFALGVLRNVVHGSKRQWGKFFFLNPAAFCAYRPSLKQSGPVAQWIERHLRNVQVAGSNPARPTPPLF